MQALRKLKHPTLHLTHQGAQQPAKLTKGATAKPNDGGHGVWESLGCVADTARNYEQILSQQNQGCYRNVENGRMEEVASTLREVVDQGESGDER